MSIYFRRYDLHILTPAQSILDSRQGVSYTPPTDFLQNGIVLAKFAKTANSFFPIHIWIDIYWLYTIIISTTTHYIKKTLVTLAVAVICIVLYLFLAIAYRPSGPFDPLIETDFFFDKTGTRELTFTPKFFRAHEVSIIASQPFPVKEQFRWKANVQVYRFGFKIDDHELEENHRGFARNSLENCQSISFGWIRTFDIIPGKTTVRIIVQQGDPDTSKYSSSFKVVVRPSPII